MSVVHVWAGAVTDSSVWVRGKVTGSSTRLAVDTDPAFSSPTFFGPDTPTADGMVSLTATGLSANTRYYYALEDDSVLDTAGAGAARTHPGPVGERASYIFGAAGDAGLTGAGDDSYITSAVSNNPVFDTMRLQSLAEDWAWFSHLGDLHYRNIATADAALYRAAYDDNFTFNSTLGTSARQGLFLRAQPVTYMWDDHDFGPNNSDSTAAGNATANAVYRERVPHYSLDGSSGIYQSWQAGRVLYVASDCRTFRDPNSDPQTSSKTMLGSAQKSWMESVLTAGTGAEALVWQTSSRWLASDSATGDTWNSFLHERNEIIELFGDTGWLDRMIQLTADQHNLSLCSGPGNRWGGFPIFMLASMDSAYGSADPLYDLGAVPGRQQYGTIRVRDNGHTIALTGTGYINGAVWNSNTKYVNVGNPVLALGYTTHLVPPMDETDDDQFVVNQVTAQREGGGEITLVKDEGALSVQDPPDGAGPYPPEQVTVQVPTDDDLPSHAGWRLYLGTVDEPRYPAISLDLGRNPELIDTVATQDIGDALTISGTPSWLPPDGIDQHIDGYTETLNAELWDWQANGAPGSPWGQIAQLPPGDETTARPDQPNRLDTTASHLTDAVTTTGTELFVHTPQDGVHDRAVWLMAMRLLNGNYDFETGLTEWVGNGATIDRVATPTPAPFPGSWSMRIVPDGVAEFPNAGSDQYAVVPGEDYTVSGWLRCAVARGVDLNINWFDASHNYLSTGSNGIAVTADTWAFIEGTFTAPASAAYANMAPTMDSFPPSSHVLHADILTIRPAGPSASMPAQLPYDLKLGGEIVRATSVEPLVWDEFGRTATDTWGTSSSGHAYTETGGAATDRAVAGGSGTITLTSPSTEIRFQRAAETVTDAELHVTLAVDQTATGASIIPGVMFRWTGTNDFYRARLHFGTGGSMFTSVTRGTTQIGTAKQLVFSYTPGQVFHLRARLIGHRILIRAWPDSQAEPVVWHGDETVTEALGLIESGAVGMTGSTFGGNTNTNPVVSYDEFQIVTPERITVERSLNGVVKTHTAGTAVSLARPAVLGL